MDLFFSLFRSFLTYYDALRVCAAPVVCCLLEVQLDTEGNKMLVKRKGGVLFLGSPRI